MSLSGYLHAHFVDKPKFAVLIGIPVERLDRLVADGAVPQPTYTCTGSSIHSAVFGEIPVEVELHGEFFRPECLKWAKIAVQASPGGEREAVEAQLSAELKDALHRQGVDSEAIPPMIQDYLPSFWDGTFGLCVADPSTGSGIVEKELLQERLKRLTENGRNPAPQGITKAELLALIDAYAQAAMPFSPAEYARCSRKRLVDDLRVAIGKA